MEVKERIKRFIKYRIIIIRKSVLNTKINLILALKKTNMILMPKR